MQVRILLRTVSQTESMAMYQWGEALVNVINKHVPEGEQLSAECTVVDIRRAFAAMDAATRDRILSATVDLELMAVNVPEIEPVSKLKPTVISASVLLSVLLWLTWKVGHVANNPDVGVWVTILNHLGAWLTGLVK